MRILHKAVRNTLPRRLSNEIKEDAVYLAMKLTGRAGVPAFQLLLARKIARQPGAYLK